MSKHVYLSTSEPVETSGPLPRYVTVTPEEGAVITIAVPWAQIEAAVQAAGYEIVPKPPWMGTVVEAGLRAALERLLEVLNDVDWDRGVHGGGLAGAMVQAHAALAASEAVSDSGHPQVPPPEHVHHWGKDGKCLFPGCSYVVPGPPEREAAAPPSEKGPVGP